MARDCKPAQQEAGVTTLGKIDLAQGGDDDDVFVALKKIQESKTETGGSGSSKRGAPGGQGADIIPEPGPTNRPKPKKKVISF